MIESTIKKIRTDFSNQIIFLFCSGNKLTGIRIVKAEFDIEKKEMNYACVLPGVVHEITVNAEFSTKETDYHFSCEPELEIKRPKDKLNSM